MPDDVPTHLRRLLEGEKLLAARPTWQRVDRKLSLVVALEEDGVAVERLLLRGRALPDWSDADVSFQLDYRDERGVGGPFERIDWRPKKEHNNRGLGPDQYRHRPISGSQLHPLDLNAAAFVFPEFAQRDLPIAVPLGIEPDSFAGLLRLVAERFRIVDTTSIPLPPWPLI